MHRQRAYARAQAGTGRQYRCPCHATRAGHEQGLAEAALVGEAATQLDAVAQVLQFSQAVVGVHVFNGILAEANVQQVPFAHKGLVLGKEEGQLGQL